MAEVYYDKETRQYIMKDYPESTFTKDPWREPDFTKHTTTNEDLRKQLELVTSQYLEIKERMDQMEQRERELIKKLMEMVDVK